MIARIGESYTSRRLRISGALLAANLAIVGCAANRQTNESAKSNSVQAASDSIRQGYYQISTQQAVHDLATLPIKGSATSTGYSREKFGGDWRESNGCDTRNRILQRDLTRLILKQGDCLVLSGELDDPYVFDKSISFVRGTQTSAAVQIDHIVPVKDAWLTGGQQLSETKRVALYNDPRELLAVDGPSNESKSDGDAATWLPTNKSFRCTYVAGQIEVKEAYNLWVTSAEHDAMVRVLGSCAGLELDLPSA